jgi:hypothetical protein
VPTTAAPTTAPTTAAPTTAPAVPAILPIVAPQAGPIPPPATFGQLAEVYLTPLACSSQGVHPTVLHALPEIVSAAETGPWFVVTVGQYTGVYQEWYVKSKPLCTFHPNQMVT